MSESSLNLHRVAIAVHPQLPEAFVEADEIVKFLNEKGVQTIHGSLFDEALRYHDEGHFPPGSMGPKVTAAIDFLKGGGSEVIITNPESIERALDGETGTRVTK